MSQLVDDLKAARALIDTPEKWTTGVWRNNDKTAYCGYGAVYFVTMGDPAHSRDDLEGQSRRRGATLAALTLALPEPYFCVPDFNDAPETTHADVLALFDRAIESAAVDHALHTMPSLEGV